MMSEDDADIGGVTAAVTETARTEQEMAAGRQALERYAQRMSSKKKTCSNTLSALETEYPIADKPDPDITLPADVQAAICRANAALEQQDPARSSRRNGPLPRIIASVADQNVQERRESNLETREQPPRGGRRQPPMTARLRAVMILVDHLMADGMPFGVGSNSRMNKAVRDWLNEKANSSHDPRPSRHKQITPEAVRELLKQVRAEGQPVTRQSRKPKRTPQEEARERLKELRARRLSGAD